MYHLDHHVLLKIVVVITTAVVIVYLSAIGAIDLTSTASTSQSALTPTQAGESLVADGNYAEAIELYQEQITSLEGALAEANLSLAQAYQGSNQLADAEAIYRRVLRLTKDLQAAYAGLADVLLDQGRDAEASAVLRQGLTAFPGDAELLQLDDLASQAAGA